MSSLLNDIVSQPGPPVGSNIIQDASNAIGSVILGGSNNVGLPSSRVPSMQAGNAVRNMAYWFVPEVGIINMYINPQSIKYSLKKIINKEQTKGGFIIQYWGEDLTTLDISGHTGSSGVNGLNVLEEVYRAEQYLFDPIALSMSSDNSISGLNSLVDSSLGNIGGLAGSISQATDGIIGLDPASQNVLPRVVPSLASIALGIEFYFNGWKYRGYFNSFSFSESADRLGIFDYQIQFVATQRTGYRTNSLPWSHSAIDGPSNWGTTPLSISTLTK